MKTTQKTEFGSGKTYYVMSIIYLLLLINYVNATAVSKNASDTSSSITNKPVIRSKEKQSITIKFDLIIDGDITENDPRIKSIVHSAKSYQRSQIEISYRNPNALDTANRVALIFTKLGLTVLKPRQLPMHEMNEPSISRYVLVNIRH